jgi:hypothetical protein
MRIVNSFYIYIGLLVLIYLQALQHVGNLLKSGNHLLESIDCMVNVVLTTPATSPGHLSVLLEEVQDENDKLILYIWFVGVDIPGSP